MDNLNLMRGENEKVLKDKDKDKEKDKDKDKDKPKPPGTINPRPTFGCA